VAQRQFLGNDLVQSISNPLLAQNSSLSSSISGFSFCNKPLKPLLGMTINR
jgi:hypothetical protein